MWKINTTTCLSLINAVLLSYTAWVKYTVKGCSSCNQIFFLPIDGVIIALIGVVASVTLAVLNHFSMRFSSLKYLTLLTAMLCASFASFLQFAQFFWAGNLCYFCLTATIIFYVIFGNLLYKVVIKSIWKKINSSTTIPPVSQN